MRDDILSRPRPQYCTAIYDVELDVHMQAWRRAVKHRREVLTFKHGMISNKNYVYFRAPVKGVKRKT